jgi:hypothetical protein
MFRVWGLVDGAKFVEVFANIREWRTERDMCVRAGVVVGVHGMQSVTEFNELACNVKRAIASRSRSQSIHIQS